MALGTTSYLMIILAGVMAFMLTALIAHFMSRKRPNPINEPTEEGLEALQEGGRVIWDPWGYEMVEVFSQMWTNSSHQSRLVEPRLEEVYLMEGDWNVETEFSIESYLPLACSLPPTGPSELEIDVIVALPCPPGPSPSLSFAARSHSHPPSPSPPPSLAAADMEECFSDVLIGSCRFPIPPLAVDELSPLILPFPSSLIEKKSVWLRTGRRRATAMSIGPR